MSMGHENIITQIHEVFDENWNDNLSDTNSGLKPQSYRETYGKLGHVCQGVSH